MAVKTHTGKEQLAGLVERVTFHSPESGFCVLKAKVRGYCDDITIVGTLPQVCAGEWVDAQGRWVVDRDYGSQFRAEVLRTASPTTAEGIEKYLASGLIKGIGTGFARRLVKHFRENVLDIIESSPKKLLEVEGIGPQRYEKITSAWSQQRIVRQIMVFLHSHGVSTSRAFRIYRQYGENSVEEVSHDPYRLARDVRGIGFKSTDKIAGSLGIEKQSPLRARAGIEYVLQELTGKGHCGYPVQSLVKLAAEMLEMPVEIVQTEIDSVLKQGRLVLHAAEQGPELIYLAGLDKSEQNLAQGLKYLQQTRHPCPHINIEKAVQWVESKIGLQLAQQQRQALRLASKEKVLAITGGPGVGKTTVINSLVKIMQAKKLQVVLAAPTGRAAKRMTEATGLNAKTIHRLLEFNPRTGDFDRNQTNPLKGDVFIIDETSMLDVVLANQLIRSIPQHSAIILVGDVDQLPSVGPGCVLRDIIESGSFAVCRLTEIFRQAAKSAIVTNAHRINRGQFPLIPEKGDKSDFYFIQAEDPEKALSIIQELVCQAIPKHFGFDSFEDIQVLTPMQKGVLGCRNLNNSLQASLNAYGDEVNRYGWSFKKGDKVMQTVNDYDKDVYNGDMGCILKLDKIDQQVVVGFDNRKVEYDFNELDELMLAYAVTVHKSQGCEYPAVIIPVHTQHYTLLQRNLLYTAITRGRKLVVVVGTKKAVSIAVKRADSHKRVTLLKNRLQNTESAEL